MSDKTEIENERENETPSAPVYSIEPLLRAPGTNTIATYAVKRADAVLGSYDALAKHLFIKPGAEKYRPSLIRWLRREGKEVVTNSVEAAVVDAPAPAPAGDVAPAPAPAPAKAAPARVASHFKQFAPHKHPRYPDGPDLDPMLGTKTPAFVEWLEAKNAAKK